MIKKIRKIIKINLIIENQLVEYIVNFESQLLRITNQEIKNKKYIFYNFNKYIEKHIQYYIINICVYNSA